MKPQKKVSCRWTILPRSPSHSSNTLATWCKEQTHWKRPWSWETLRAGREECDRGWDDWMASLTGHEFEQTLRDGEGQGSLMCCSHAVANRWTRLSNWAKLSLRGLPCGSEAKNPSANAGFTGSISESGRSPAGGHGNSLQYSCLENSMDRGAWRAIVHSVAEESAWLKWLNNKVNNDPPWGEAAWLLTGRAIWRRSKASREKYWMKLDLDTHEKKSPRKVPGEESLLWKTLPAD